MLLSRVLIVLPPDPVCNNEVRGCRNQEQDEVFVMRVLGQGVKDLVFINDVSDYERRRALTGMVEGGRNGLRSTT